REAQRARHVGQPLHDAPRDGLRRPALGTRHAARDDQRCRELLRTGRRAGGCLGLFEARDGDGWVMGDAWWVLETRYINEFLCSERLSSIHRDNLTCHPGSLVADQERRDLGYLFG